MAEKSIGYVIELAGSAEVKTVEGIIKVLSIGDKIHDGDILTTGVYAEIRIEFYNGRHLQISENSEVLLDESVYANLQILSDDRVDQLAELQQLIVEGVDLADLEAAAVGTSQTTTADALHSTSIYSRDGVEGFVETQGTPIEYDGTGPGTIDSSDSGASLTLANSTDTPSLTISSDDADLTAGETATITFTFSEAASGFADADISVTGGSLGPISTLDGG
ncbi:MAG: hypothetical protein GY820_06645, partial [Gammaproteobacteria bacterium]|nr:hypothetical protein [Gammaproteobacteria bacterium]